MAIIKVFHIFLGKHYCETLTYGITCMHVCMSARYKAINVSLLDVALKSLKKTEDDHQNRCTRGR